MTVLAERIFRIGKVRLLIDDIQQQYFAEIQNRTYYSCQPVPYEKVKVWYKILNGEQKI